MGCVILMGRGEAWGMKVEGRKSGLHSNHSGKAILGGF
jgi:hypothetical protein